MKRIGRLFLLAEEGFVLLLTLVMLPAFLSLALLLVDVARIGNAQADLQAVADATALAGARELDRSPNSIANARLAMAEVTNSVSMLTPGGDDEHQWLTYANAPGNAIRAVFLDAIPDDDMTPIDQAWMSAHGVADADAPDAVYVYVYVQSRDFDPLFHFMTGGGGLAEAEDVPVTASAVAKSVSAACNVTPIYICNPFEFGGVDGEPDLQQAYRDGLLHGRLIKLHPPGSDVGSPGNFGFLQVKDEDGNDASGANAISHAISSNRNPTCYDSSRVTTKPGASNGIRFAFNVRMDIYGGQYSNWNNTAPNSFPIASAVNVRKGYRQVPPNGNSPINPCNTVESTDPVADGLMGFPDDTIMSPPNQGIAGAFFGNGDWDLEQYVRLNYGTTHAATILTGMRAATSFLGREPSRYDVYLYELNNPHPSNTATNAPRLYQYVNTTDPTHGNENGAAACGPTKTHPIPSSSDPDRRIIFAAIIDCESQSSQGGGINNYAVNSFASVFLTRPMGVDGTTDGTIDIEITDITGSGAGGTLEDFVREESVLVR